MSQVKGGIVIKPCSHIGPDWQTLVLRRDVDKESGLMLWQAFCRYCGQPKPLPAYLKKANWFEIQGRGE